MNTKRLTLPRLAWLGLLAWMIALGLALFIPAPVYADDCLWQPWNLTDCLRTPGFREVYVAVLAGLGVGPAILSQILAEGAKSNLTEDDINKLIWNKVFERVKQWLTRQGARQAGASLAANTPNILDSLNQSTSPPQPPPQPPPPDAPPIDHIYDFSPGKIVSGDQARKYLEQTGALERVKNLLKGDDWDAKIKSMEGDPGKPTVTDFIIKWNNDGTPDLDDLVFVIPQDQPQPPATGPTPPEQEPEPVEEPEEEEEEEEEKEEEKKKPKAAKPPEKEKEPEVKKAPPEEKKPPDLRKLLDAARKERAGAEKRIVDLLKKKTDLLNKLVEKTAEYDRTLNKAVTDGIVDIVDIVTDILQPVKILETSTFKGAYAKDLIKSALKGLLGEAFSDGLQVSDLQKISWTDAVKPSGVVLDRPMSDYFEKPDRVLDYLMPGGGIKQLIQNAMDQESFSNKLYGPGETAVKATQDFRDANEKSIQLRAEINEIQKGLTSTRNEIEDQQAAFEIANNSVKRNQANIDELKTMFPNRFRNL